MRAGDDAVGDRGGEIGGEEEGVADGEAPIADFHVVADDDASVRSFAEDALRLLGYEVTVCDSGTSAIGCCERLGTAISACVLDLRMPGPTGMMLVQRLRAIVPELPILFVSGNADATEEVLLKLPRVSFLEKPYRLTELGDALDRLLATQRAPRDASRSRAPWVRPRDT